MVAAAASVHLFVAAGEGRRHAADGHCAVLAAHGHEAAEHVRQEVRGLDVHAVAVGPDLFGVGHDVLQDAGLQVPAGGVEAGGVGPQRVQHLLHRVHGRQGLDEDDAPNGGVPQAGQLLLACGEDVAVPGDLVGRLGLGDVEVDALASGGLGLACVEEGEGRAQERRRDGRAVDRHVRLVQVEAALPVHEEGDVALADAVLAVAGGVGVGEGALDGVAAVDGGLHVSCSRWPGRVLVVVKVALGAGAVGAGVERVDEHGRHVDGPGDLDARQPQLLRHGWRLPVAVRLAGGQRGEGTAAAQRAVEQLRSRRSQRVDARAMGVVEGQEVAGEVGGEELVGPLDGSVANAVGRGHRCGSSGVEWLAPL